MKRRRNWKRVGWQWTREEMKDEERKEEGEEKELMTTFRLPVAPCLYLLFRDSKVPQNTASFVQFQLSQVSLSTHHSLGSFAGGDTRVTCTFLESSW